MSTNLLVLREDARGPHTLTLLATPEKPLYLHTNSPLPQPHPPTPHPQPQHLLHIKLSLPGPVQPLAPRPSQLGDSTVLASPPSQFFISDPANSPCATSIILSYITDPYCIYHYALSL